MTQGTLHVPTDKQRNQISAAKACGLTHQAIADLMDIDEKTLVKHYKRELAIAHDKAVMAVASNLYRHATGDGKSSVQAACFWLKTRAGWREVHTVEHSSPDGSMTPKAALDASGLSTTTLLELMAAKRTNDANSAE